MKQRGTIYTKTTSRQRKKKQIKKIFTRLKCVLHLINGPTVPLLLNSPKQNIERSFL